ncbi:MAG: hypothetical protein ACLVKK_10875 [Ruthenibacterium sp.]
MTSSASPAPQHGNGRLAVLTKAFRFSGGFFRQLTPLSDGSESFLRGIFTGTGAGVRNEKEKIPHAGPCGRHGGFLHDMPEL